MSFKMIRHYIVQPKIHLRQKVAEFEAKAGAHSASLLTDRIMWSCVPDRHEHPVAGLVKMKFYFLMDIHDDFLSHPHTLVYPFVKGLLGEPPYTEQIFDLWWRVAQVTDGGSVEATEAGFRERNLGSLVSSPHPVIEMWLERFRKKD